MASVWSRGVAFGVGERDGRGSRSGPGVVSVGRASEGNNLES